MVNMAHLKGNLGLKSSSLAPTACKLSTQYMVLDHMTNHYNKISQAKSAIDNKPPKSITTSQKMRDRKTRERVTSPHRNRPLSSMSHTQGHTYHDDVQDYQDFLNEEPDDDEGRLVHSIMKTTLAKKSNGSNDATFNSKTQTYSNSSETAVRHENGNMAGGEHQRMTWQRPMSARSGHSVTSSVNGTQRVPITSHDQKRITYNGDILDKRSYCFTEPDRPFTPRTLRSNHQSRLKSSKCYNAPKNKTGKQSEIESSAPEQGRERESRHRPQPQPRQRNRSGQSEQFGETMATNQLSESMLMDITLQSRDGRHSQESKRDVPPLAISMDTDHFKWLQEQASKAQVRARHSSKIKPGLRPDVTMDGMEEGDEENPLNLSHSIRLETLKNSRWIPSLRSNRSINPWIYLKIIEEEEEQKYLAFAKEVTDDVLTRGISTDKVLHKVFENHIERRKGDLDETRMRAMIKDLKKDLGLRETSVERKESHTVNFSNLDKDKSSTTHSLEQDANSVHSESRDTLSSKPEVNYNGFTSNSNMTMTMESTSTMKFGQTGDLFSTIHSEQQDRDLSDGEVEMSGKETDKENENELTATQVLKEYQMNLTAKEAHGDGNGEASSSEVGNERVSDLLKPDTPDGRPATGERRADQESSTENGRTTDFSTANGTTTTANSHSNHVSSQDSSTLNGSLPRSRLRNRRRERKTKSSTASADSESVKEEPSSNSVLKSSTSVETGSERDMSESGQEMYSKPTAKYRVRSANKHSEESEPRESQGEEFKSTDRSEGSVIGEDYAGDYEDDYDEGSQENETHRTSDDDF